MRSTDWRRRIRLIRSLLVMTLMVCFPITMARLGYVTEDGGHRPEYPGRPESKAAEVSVLVMAHGRRRGTGRVEHKGRLGNARVGHLIVHGVLGDQRTSRWRVQADAPELLVHPIVGRLRHDEDLDAIHFEHGGRAHAGFLVLPHAAVAIDEAAVAERRNRAAYGNGAAPFRIDLVAKFQDGSRPTPSR